VIAKARIPNLFAGMNKTEAAYAQTLEARKRTGLIHDWKFEKLTLKIADDCRYTPDFMVIENDGAITVTEIKGFWRDDARVKIRVAAQQFPYFRFQALKKTKLGWAKEDF
jgi:hypothetical protein